MNALQCENCSAVAAGTVQLRRVPEGEVIEATECQLRTIAPPGVSESSADASMALTILSHTLGKHTTAHHSTPQHTTAHHA